MRVTEGLAEPYWAEKIVNESLATVQWMKEQGLQWGLNMGNRIKKNGKLYWPSGVTVLTGGGSGEDLVEMLFGIAENRKTKIMYEAAARSFIINSDGGVTGLIAMTREGTIQIDGKSVIMACGGFEGSPEMRRQYLGEGWDLVKLRGTRYNTGDGLRMAIEYRSAAVRSLGRLSRLGCERGFPSDRSGNRGCNPVLVLQQHHGKHGGKAVRGRGRALHSVYVRKVWETDCEAARERCVPNL